MRTNTTTALAAILALTLISAARAEDEHRELDAHVHGHGTLSIVIEGNRVAMELEAPGMDLVGFEHEAETQAQKVALKSAKDELSEPLALFTFPASAGCSVSKVKVAIQGGDEDHEGDEDHAEHADAKHDDEESASHNEFHATYALDCANPANLTSIAFDYFKSFSGANELTVNVITAKAQNTYEVNRDKPTLDLSGMM